MPKLSFCIATFKRGGLIAETLDSICREKGDDVEVVIVDGASPDATAEAVAPFVARYPNVRHYREKTNSGVDADYDKAVGYATAEYCWLFPDDDLLAPGALPRLLRQIESAPDLIVVNSEVFNADFTRSLHTRMIRITQDREYGPADRDRAFADLATAMSFIGSLVVKRSMWQSRERASYHGSLYAHVGVVFQEPPLDRIAVVAEPMIRIRYGNSLWSPRSFEVLYFTWPKMVWSFPHIAEEARRQVVPREPWRRLRSLMKSRAVGEYSPVEFRRFVAGRGVDRHVVQAALVSVFPAKAANALWVLYYALFQRSALFTLFDLLRSPHASAFSRYVAGLSGVNVVSAEPGAKVN